jgi:hypothetical protein
LQKLELLPPPHRRSDLVECGAFRNLLAHIAPAFLTSAIFAPALTSSPHLLPLSNLKFAEARLANAAGLSYVWGMASPPRAVALGDAFSNPLVDFSFKPSDSFSANLTACGKCDEIHKMAETKGFRQTPQPPIDRGRRASRRNHLPE